MVESLTQAQIAEYKEVFSVFDKDGDGKITKEELESAMRQTGVYLTPDQLEEMLGVIDVNGDGEIDFSEFIGMIAKELKMNQIKKVFRVFDKNGDGFISRDELRQTMVTYNDEKLSDEDIDVMIRAADNDGDGRVNYEEFVAIVTSQDENES